MMNYRLSLVPHFSSHTALLMTLLAMLTPAILLFCELFFILSHLTIISFYKQTNINTIKCFIEFSWELGGFIQAYIK